MYAYIVVSLLSGIRTEEARALPWELVNLEAGTVDERVQAPKPPPIYTGLRGNW
jgi:hypothetical protein